MSKIFASLICVLLSLAVLGQGAKLSKDDKEKKEFADAFYEAGNYLEALPLYAQLHASYPKDKLLKFITGVCYIYHNDERYKGIQILESIKSDNPELVDVHKYLGMAYHKTYSFPEAISELNLYMEKVDLTAEEKLEIRQLIQNCNYGRDIMQDQKEVNITNMGENINSAWSEYVPLISLDESILIFTYRGEKSTGGRMTPTGKESASGDYYEDVYISSKSETTGAWSKAESISKNINTTGQDAAVSLSGDGQKLVIYKSEQKINSDLYQSVLKGAEWSVPLSLPGEVNTKYWEGSASLSPDGLHLYFVSDKPEGIGGRDIWRATRLASGGFGTAVNLGPEINTFFDEDAPFIHPDNKTLYFSSKGHNSMGGYDIFYSELINGQWRRPTNIGYPVNTPDDDRYYVVSADGQTGYFSSGRAGGFGQHDIYTVQARTEKPPVLALVVGNVMFEELPADAKIELVNKETDEVEGVFRSNSATGRFLLTLTPGKEYKLGITVEGQEEYFEDVDVKALEAYVRVAHDFTLSKSASPEQTLQSSLDEALRIQRMNAGATFQREELASVQDTLLSLTDTDKQIIAGAQTTDLDGLYFKVEITSSGKPADELLLKLSKYGEIFTRKVGDKTRYFIGNFTNIVLAEEFRQMLATKEPEAADVFTTVFVFGDMMSIPEYAKSPCRNDEFVDFTAFVGKDLNDKEIYAQLVNTGGNFCTDGLVFKVQIGAYRFPGNFKYPYLNGLGEAVVSPYEDGITRFTMGSFHTLGEAELLRQQILKAGQKDAWVTPFYNQKRMLMHELIEVNFYGKRIN